MFDKSNEKQVKVQLMMLESDKEEVLKAAAEAGMTMSKYIRAAIKFYYEATHNTNQ